MQTQFAKGVLIAAFLLAPTAAQNDRVQKLVQRAFVDLADPAKAPDATRSLENLGPVVVPALRDVLHYSRRRDVPVLARQNALYVLGRLGRAATSAWPEVRDVLVADEPEVARQALWTLGMLVPFLTVDQGDALGDDLKRLPREVGDTSLAGILWEQTRLGPEPALRILIDQLRHREAGCVAACRWLCARADGQLGDRQQLLDEVSARREAAMARPAVKWRSRNHDFVAADLAEAWLALTKQPLDAMAARALLLHWHPDGRRRGVLWLQEHGAVLPMRERADLVARLWDADSTIVASACEAFAAWGPQGLVAQAPLRLMQRCHADPAVAARCGAAADRVLAACEKLPAADFVLLAAIDDALQLRPVRKLEGAAAQRGKELAVELLYTAEWNEAEALTQVLDLIEGVGACSEGAVASVFGWLRNENAPVVDLALAWLSRRGSAVRECFGSPFEVEVMRLSRFYVAEGSRPAAVEAGAWLLTTVVPVVDLQTQVESENLRFAARALAQLLVQSPGDLQAVRPRLHALTLSSAKQDLLLRIPGDWDEGIKLPIDLGDPVRLLAALALASLGVVPEDSNGLGALVAQHCGVGLVELPGHVASLREQHKLVDLLDRIEADCRRRMGLPANVRWPLLTPGPR